MLHSSHSVYGFIIMLNKGEYQTEKTGFDSNGGWTAIKPTKTGFFHTEHDGNRWWFVTPEGQAFLSFGINHYHAGWWSQFQTN